MFVCLKKESTITQHTSLSFDTTELKHSNVLSFLPCELSPEKLLKTLQEILGRRSSSVQYCYEDDCHVGV